MTIRSAARRDASRLAEILIFAKRTAYRPIFQNDIVSFGEMQVLDLALFFRDTADALQDVYVYDDSIVKGMMRWETKAGSEAEPAWELKELYVDPFFQKQGVGQELMKYFLASARANHVGKACLWVLEKNRVARKFYEAQGFRLDGRKRLQSGTTEHVLGYTKRL